MKRILIFAAGALLVLGAGAAWGQRIGYLDTKKVMERYSGSAELRQEVNRAVEAWNREIAARKQAIDSLERELDDQQLVISSERRKLKREEIKKRRQALEAFVREIYDQGGKAEQKNRELARPMVDKIGAIVKKVAVDNNLQVVLDSSTGGLVYAAKDLDITDLVIEELDKSEGRTAKIAARVVVFPLNDADQEAARKKYGKQVYDLLWGSLDRANTAKPLAKREVEDLLKDKGLANKPVPEARAYELARILNAEYMALGQVAADAQSGRITITAKLYNVDLKQLLIEAAEEARDETEMSSAADKLVERLGQKVMGQ
jgi:outer membrane protein